MRNLLLAAMVAGIALFNLNLQAQPDKCGTMSLLEKKMKSDPSILLRMQQSEIATQQWIAAQSRTKGTQQIITIPVVVHVIWHDPVENVSDAQIQSQIDILNEDFRLMNPDSLAPSHPFWMYTADSKIEFCLANTGPDGAATNGITRTYTDSVSFSGNDFEKYTASGGKDNWDPTKYMNVWVCNLNGSNGTLGYAAFPFELAANPGNDGIVIRYEAFGNTGTAGTGGFTQNALGRTATHEVGHWLNLFHIWGDNEPNCGNDSVDDTPPAYQSNAGCPAFPHNPNSPCGTNANGEMFMNYMDYVDDNCMIMFTVGQSNRMHAALNGDRIALLTSTACSPLTANETLPEISFDIYPNPNKGNFSITLNSHSSKITTVNVLNILGKTVKTINNITSNIVQVNLSEFAGGPYYLQISMDNKMEIRKVIIIK